MELKEILLLYLRSPLNASVAGLFMGIAALSVLLSGVPAFLAVPGAAAGYVLVSGLILLSRKGAKSIAGEKERDRLASTRSKVEEAERVRKRLEYLRIPEPAAAEAVRRLMYISGQYLDTCRKYSTWSPVANERLEDALSVLSDLLKELDEQAAERHFGVSDDSPFPDIVARAVSALDEDCRIIREKIRELEGGLDAGDRMSIREDLS